ncbi:MAG: 3-hydroxyacyl-CoA dehydrogenase NAD-binding domain-containing protein [Clostridiaceae bacterium]
MKKTEFENVVIAGAGLMGASIAQAFQKEGFQTSIYCNIEEPFERARTIISNCQKTLVENKVLTKEESELIQSGIIYTTDTACFKNADLVIEAIPEVFEIKRQLFEIISEILPESSVIATNTSAISVNDLSKYVKNPERFCGTHWLNPAHIIPLVEIVKSDVTAEWVVEALNNLFIGMGKQPVVLKKDVKGFLSNRLQFALLREASYLVESGVATPDDIDRTLKYGNGLRYMCSGPFKIVDMGGIEVFNNVAKYLYPDLCNNREKNSLLEEMVEKGNNGISTGKGFYTYDRNSALEEELIRDYKMLKALEI